MHEQREFLTEAEVEDLTGIKRGTWRNKRSAGLDPAYYKVHGRVLYRRDELLAFLEASRVEPTST